MEVIVVNIDSAARCYVFGNNSYSYELLTAGIIQNILHSIYGSEIINYM